MDWQKYRHAGFVDSNKRNMLRRMNEYKFIVIKFYANHIGATFFLFPSNIEIAFNLLIKYLDRSYDFHLGLFYTNELQVSYRAIFYNHCKFPVTP